MARSAAYALRLRGIRSDERSGPPPPRATIIASAFCPCDDLIDRGQNRIGPRMMGHVPDAFEHDEVCAFDVAHEASRMNARRNRVVGVSRDDYARHLDLS